MKLNTNRRNLNDNDTNRLIRSLQIVALVSVTLASMMTLFTIFYVVWDYDIPPIRIMRSVVDFIGFTYSNFPSNPAAFWLSSLMNIGSLVYAILSMTSSSQQFAELRTELNQVLRVSKNIQRKI
ncbi:MAG: hypothetical protein QM523_10115 [Candidatus Pacebacteria bacterium]|nr:hypothetical protein [Candidatus Paceibacterota bacterium]